MAGQPDLEAGVTASTGLFFCALVAPHPIEKSRRRKRRNEPLVPPLASSRLAPPDRSLQVPDGSVAGCVAGLTSGTGCVAAGVGGAGGGIVFSSAGSSHAKRSPAARLSP